MESFLIGGISAISTIIDKSIRSPLFIDLPLAARHITVKLIQALSRLISDDMIGKNSDSYVKATMTEYDLTRDLYISE